MATQELVSLARRKKTEGLPLTSEEDKAVKAYYREYMRASTRIYFDAPAEMKDLQALASKEGDKNFSHWLLEKVKLAATGDVVDRRYVTQLQKDLEKARKDFEYERNLSEETRRRARELEEKLLEANRKIQEYADEFVKLANALKEERQ